MVHPRQIREQKRIKLLRDARRRLKAQQSADSGIDISGNTSTNPDLETYLDWEDEFSLTESLTHVLPYELTYKGLTPVNVRRLTTEGLDGIVGDKEIKDEDGVTRRYYIKKVKTDAGLNCFILFSSHADNPRVRVLFRGTGDIESAVRDFEELGSDPGGLSFKRHEKEVMKAVKQVVKYKVKHKCKKVEMTTAGHSLGGADSQRFASMVLKHMAENPTDKEMAKIGKLNVMHANSAGISQATHDQAEKSLQALIDLSKKSGKTPIEVTQSIIHVGGDGVQTTGDKTLFAEANSEHVHTLVFRCDLKKTKRNPIEPHRTKFAGREFDVGTLFSFKVLDNQDETGRQNIYEMLNFKSHNILSIKNIAVQGIEFLKVYRQASPHIKKFVSGLDAIAPYAQYGSQTFIEDLHFDYLIKEFQGMSEEYFKDIKGVLSYAMEKLDTAAEIVPYIEAIKKNVQFIADILSCIQSYAEFKDYLTPAEKKACQIGIAMIAIAGALTMAPILAPGAVPASLAMSLSTVCAGLIREGSYLCKMGLRRHKELKGHSMLFESLDKYAQSLSTQEQNNLFSMGIKEHAKRMIQYGVKAKVKELRERVNDLLDNLSEARKILSENMSGNMTRYEFVKKMGACVKNIVKNVKAISQLGNNPVASAFLSSATSLLELIRTSETPKQIHLAVQSFVSSAYTMIAGQAEAAESYMPQSRIEDVAEPLYDSLNLMKQIVPEDSATEPLGPLTVMAGLSLMLTGNGDTELKSVAEETIATGQEIIQQLRAQPNQKPSATPPA